MSVRSKDGKHYRTAEENREIDLSLAVMCAVQIPGECVPRDVIAEITGMSHGGPWAIEQRAMMKIRKKLLYTDRELGNEIRT